jgi:DNA-binding transcriptional ArsR family regulator
MASRLAGTTRAYLHPARLRIAAELAGRAGLSAAELRERLPDLPLASLYRHLDILLAAGIVEAGASRGADARGPAERVFALPSERGILPDDLRRDPANAQRVAVAMCAHIMGQFSRYLTRSRPSRGPRPVFRGWPIYADDEEFSRLTAAVVALGERAERTPPRRGRTRRWIYVMTIPETGETT